MNCVLLADSISSGNPILENTWKKDSVITSKVIYFNGMASGQRVHKSIMVKVNLFLFSETLFSRPTISTASFGKGRDDRCVGCMNALGCVTFDFVS